MANGIDLPILNQDLVSWPHARWIVSLPDFGGVGGRFYGIHSFDMGAQKRERTAEYGQLRSGAPLGFSAGQYENPKPKIGWHAHSYLSEPLNGTPGNQGIQQWKSFLAFLSQYADVGPSRLRSIGDIRMNWQLFIDDGGIQAVLNYYTVYLVGDGGTWEKGADGLKCETEFTALRMNISGATLYDSTEE